MKRYDFDWTYVGIESNEREDGEWVRYVDALAFYSKELDRAYAEGRKSVVNDEWLCGPVSDPLNDEWPINAERRRKGVFPITQSAAPQTEEQRTIATLGAVQRVIEVLGKEKK